MKKRYHFLLFIAVLALAVILIFLFAGLQEKEPSQTDTPSTQESAEASSEASKEKLTEPPTEPASITVYENAVEHYLGENGDYTEFSYEREYPPEFVVLHFCSAVVNHRNDPYNMKYVRQTFIDADVSIHYILDREGKIYCYVPEDRVAWHAGKGTWKNDEKYQNKMNHYSIGIELVGIGSQEDMAIYLSKAEYNALDDSLKGFTDAQYISLKALVEDICLRYDIPVDRDHVIGHEEYSPRKNDPGELFDWTRIIPKA